MKNNPEAPKRRQSGGIYHNELHPYMLWPAPGVVLLLRGEISQQLHEAQARVSHYIVSICILLMLMLTLPNGTHRHYLFLLNKKKNLSKMFCKKYLTLEETLRTTAPNKAFECWVSVGGVSVGGVSVGGVWPVWSRMRVLRWLPSPSGTSPSWSDLWGRRGRSFVRRAARRTRRRDLFFRGLLWFRSTLKRRSIDASVGMCVNAPTFSADTEFRFPTFALGSMNQYVYWLRVTGTCLVLGGHSGGTPTACVFDPSGIFPFDGLEKRQRNYIMT